MQYDPLKNRKKRGSGMAAGAALCYNGTIMLFQ